MQRLLIFAALLLEGCTGGSHAEYVSVHPWIGKCAAFSQPIVYITNLSTDLEREEIVRIGRVVERRDFGEYLRQLPKGKNLVLTPVAADTTFKVSMVFTIVYEGYSRMFVDDLEMAVLTGSDGLVSAANLGSLENCREVIKE